MSTVQGSTIQQTPHLASSHHGDGSIESQIIVDSSQYKAALSLNNIGVALIERNSYRDALKTFRLAFKWIRSLEESANPISTRIAKDESTDISQSVHSPERKEEIDNDLTEAKNLLRKCQVGPKSQKQILSKGMPLFTCTMVVDTSYDEVLEAATSYPIRSHGYAIMIDTSSDDDYTSYVVLQTSIILMNFAVAYQCQTNLQSSKSERDSKYLTSGHKLFSLAHELLEQEEKRLQHQLYNSEVNGSVLYYSDYVDQIQLIRLIAIQALMHLSFDMRKPDEGQQYYLLLGDLHVGYEKPQEEFKRSRVFAPAA
jgi:hypothetical protein